MKPAFCILIGLCLAVFTAGCEVDLGTYGDQDATGTTDTATTPTTTNGLPATPTTTNTTPVVDPRADDLNISSAVMLGPHKDMVAQEAGITRTLYSANKDGDVVKLSFETLNWSTETGSNGKTIDGMVYIFWQVSGGQVMGGMFDWHGVGQTAKTLDNIYGGYLDGQKPPAGAPIWFCLLNREGNQRTNVKKSNTNW